MSTSPVAVTSGERLSSAVWSTGLRCAQPQVSPSSMLLSLSRAEEVEGPGDILKVTYTKECTLYNFISMNF